MSAGTALSKDWQETTVDTHAWLSKLDPYDRPLDLPNVQRRFFIFKGGPWPLFSVSVRVDDGIQHGVTVGCGCKTGPEAWMETWPVPRALVPVLVEMLHAVGTEQIKEPDDVRDR